MEDASFLNPLVSLVQQTFTSSFTTTTTNNTSYDNDAFGAASSPYLASSPSLPIPVPALPSNFLCPKGGEGYGPYSTVRQMDLTPCFESLILTIPLGLLLVVGSGSIGWLARKGERRIRGGWSSKILHWKLALLVLASISAAIHLVFTLLPILRFSPSTSSSSPPSPLVTIHTLYSLLLLLSTLLLLPLTYFTHTRTRRSSDLILVFWTLFVPLSLPRLRTFILLDVLSDRSKIGGYGWAIWASSVAHLVFGGIAFGLECLGPEFIGFGKEGRIRLSEGEGEGIGEDGKQFEVNEKENPALTANFFSRITFSWLTPLMKLGSTRFIQEDDIFDLVPTDTADVLGQKLAHHWSKTRASTAAKAAQYAPSTDPKKLPKPSLFIAIARAYGGPYVVASIFKACNDCLSFAQPQLLRLLLKFVASHRTETPDPPIQGIVIALMMFIAAIVQTSLLHQYFDRAFTTGMRVKAGIITLIYKKALVLSNSEKSGRASGDIVNLQSVDALRIADLMQYGQMAWSAPLQITLAFISLYNLLGWPAFCGVAVMVVSLPLNAMIARYQKRLQVQQMKIKDKRTRLMNEVLSNIKSIKLYAWEKAFSEKVLKVRNDEELMMIRKIGIVNSVSNFFWASTPFLVAYATFSAFALTSKVALTSDLIFPAISLFTLLQFPLAMLSMIISSIIEAIVSEGRLVSFLDAEELQPDARKVIMDESQEPRKGDELVSIREGSFKWSKTAEGQTLKGIDLSVKKGELVAILGRVGDGKTSLLAAALGEMTRSAGSVTVRGSVAYFSQQSWVLSATVKENIVFGHAFDQEFYVRVLEACALPADLKMLPSGDMTEVGEKGVSLSGGQKARIALARAVYARADIYLLDDPLCAVDNHVAAHLFKHVLGPEGLLKGKARVLCTNSVSFLSQTDKLLMLRGGQIIEQSAYSKVMEERDSPLYSLINGLGKQVDSSPVTPSNENSDGSTTAVEDELDVDQLGEKVDGKRRFSVSSLKKATMLSDSESKYQAIRDLKLSTKPREKMEQGQVKTHIYRNYISSASTIGVVTFLIAIFAAQGSSLVGNLVLRRWGERNLSEHKTAQIGVFLFYYGLAGISASGLNMAASLLLWVYCAIRCSKKLHDGAFKSLMRSPMSYFELVPQGQILNLFSRDIYVIDEVLVRTFSGFFRTAASVFSVLFVIGMGAPVVLLGVIPIGIIYRKIMAYYLATSRELKRLDSTSRAPIFSWFGETIGGLSTIRAYAQQNRFAAGNEARLDRNNACYLPSVSVNRWLAVRLEFLGSLIMLSAALVSVFALTTSKAENIDAGLVGLMLSYAISVTGSLNWVVRSASEVETNIVSVERVFGYTELPSEAADDIPEKQPVDAWPQAGAISFRDYSTRYRVDLQPCIREITLDIQPGEKIGVCGRTGAGKSSLTLALFRIIEATHGKIEIDGVDIASIGLHDLRSKISIIPQDPQLFEGTLRENVDPVSAYTDEEIWQALEQSHLKPFVISNGGLDGAVSEGGSNLSSGQRQLICFARALLRKSRILVLDEATSAIDLETDAAVQEILRGPDFKNTTTITIAHRLDTILHSTRVLVMNEGRIAEFDSPEKLLGDSKSIFYSLASQAGLLNVET